VVIDESDRERLGVSGVGAVGEVRGRRARVVGLVRGYSGLSGAHVFCSVETARELLLFPPDRVTYILARCRDRAAAPAVAQRLRVAYPGLSAFTTEGLSRQSRWYWLTETKAGLALGYAAILGLIVGAVVTGQTLYTATAAQLRDYAVLWALGVPLRRMAAVVLAEAFGVGVAGVVVAVPVIFLLAKGASLLNVTVLLPVWVLAATAGITLVMALASGLAGLRLLWRLEPAALLR
jgi:putative ABC transport system permease protein